MKPPRCVGFADCCCYYKFNLILLWQNFACSFILYLFGIAIRAWFVPVKSLAYMVTKITVHISVLNVEKEKAGEVVKNVEAWRIEKRTISCGLRK